MEQLRTCAGDAVSSVAFLTETLESWRLVDAVGIVVTEILSQLTLISICGITNICDKIVGLV